MLGPSLQTRRSNFPWRRGKCRERLSWQCSAGYDGRLISPNLLHVDQWHTLPQNCRKCHHWSLCSRITENNHRMQGCCVRLHSLDQAAVISASGLTAQSLHPTTAHTSVAQPQANSTSYDLFLLGSRQTGSPGCAVLVTLAKTPWPWLSLCWLPHCPHSGTHFTLTPILIIKPHHLATADVWSGEDTHSCLERSMGEQYTVLLQQAKQTTRPTLQTSWKK